MPRVLQHRRQQILIALVADDHTSSLAKVLTCRSQLGVNADTPDVSSYIAGVRAHAEYRARAATRQLTLAR